ncbi:alpha/beta hydrolase fold domain-containing protein [Kytococcus sp. Marseille-QA3725]
MPRPTRSLGPFLACVALLAGCSTDDPDPAGVPRPAAPVTDSDGRVSQWTGWQHHGSHERQRYRLLPGDEGGGVAVLVHGGSWHAGSADTYTAERSTMHVLVEALHQEGWWVVATEYRYADRSRWPATAQDVHASTRAGVHLARERGAGDRLVMMGDSAGGHLAAFEGVTHPQQVDAVVAYYGLHDFTTSAEQRAERDCPPMNVGAPNLFGSEPTTPELTARAREASPVHRVGRDSPPMMLLHGTEDCVVPPQQSRQLRDALADSGVPAELVELEGEGHGGPAFVTPDGTLPQVLGFLEEHAPVR